MSRQGCRDNYPEDFDEGEGRVEGRGDLLSREEKRGTGSKFERGGRAGTFIVDRPGSCPVVSKSLCCGGADSIL